MKDTFYVSNGVICHQNISTFADVDIEFKGSWDDCQQYLASEAGVDVDDTFDYQAFQDECAQDQDLLDQQSISDAYEEMQELDPRDYDRVDDFGDPTT